MSDQTIEMLFAEELDEAIDLLDLVPSELRIEVLNSPIYQAPSFVEFYISGGQGGQGANEAVISIDGTDLMTVNLDSSGALSLAAVALSEALGTAGTHTITVTQDDTATGTLVGNDTFDVTIDPEPLPDPPPTDGTPFLPAGAVVPGRDVQRWVLQDPYVSGGIGSYVFPQNPKEMTSPHFERFLTSKRTSLSVELGGKFHVFESAGQPKEWQFSGICSSSEMHDKLLAFRALNRRFWLIDHRNRAWKVVFTNVDITPRLRTNYNGQLSDWIEDYTVSALILDQSPTEPA